MTYLLIWFDCEQVAFCNTATAAKKLSRKTESAFQALKSDFDCYKRLCFAGSEHTVTFPILTFVKDQANYHINVLDSTRFALEQWEKWKTLAISTNSLERFLTAVLRNHVASLYELLQIDNGDVSKLDTLITIGTRVYQRISKIEDAQVA